MGLYIEIKGHDFHRKHHLDPGFKLLEVLKKYGYKNNSDPIFIQSFDSDMLKYLRHELKTKSSLYSYWEKTVGDYRIPILVT